MRDPLLLGNWLGWMLALTEKPPAKVCIVSQDTRARRAMLQAEWEQAIPRHVGEFFTKAKVEVDTERVAPVASRCSDEIGRQVQETTYTDLKRLPSGRWMPLTWHKRSLPRESHRGEPW